ncbi:hypothetical protein D3C71_928430 [compost metagenome]
MANKVRFSQQHSKIEDIEKFYFYSEQSLIPYFSEKNSYFTGFSISELDEELKQHKLVLDRMNALEILALLEARFRIDYLIRCQERKKDDFSRALREVYKQRENKASLTDDILKLWKEFYPQHKTIFDSFQKALDYRNWLAHGRYWEPKKSPHISKYDYLTISLIASEIMKNLILFED